MSATVRKCTYCVDRFEEGKLPDCVEACPVRAMDACPLEEMQAKYGTNVEAVDSMYSKRTKQAVVIKSKKVPNNIQ